jgi:hypothetical protein
MLKFVPVASFMTQAILINREHRIRFHLTGLILIAILK